MAPAHKTYLPLLIVTACAIGVIAYFLATTAFNAKQTKEIEVDPFVFTNLSTIMGRVPKFDNEILELSFDTFKVEGHVSSRQVFHIAR